MNIPGIGPIPDFFQTHVFPTNPFENPALSTVSVPQKTQTKTKINEEVLLNCQNASRLTPTVSSK